MSDKDNFIISTRARALVVKEEYLKLVQEYRRITMEIARTKSYLNILNKFLIEHGYEPIPIPNEKEDK